MISFDTNLAVYAANSSMPEHSASRAFLESLAKREDVLVCDLMLVELYLKLRNPKIFSSPLTAPTAAAWCECLRDNKNWGVIESAPVMAEVWRQAAQKDFAMRRIIDARLALTLRHHGVTEFATSNMKDFQGFGFARVWNPLND
jgi:toxin-antitoxin system PIN domain toxin